jgi:hypothetical protein
LETAFAFGFLAAADLAFADLLGAALVTDLAALLELALVAALVLEPLVVTAFAVLLAAVLVVDFLLDAVLVDTALVAFAFVPVAAVVLEAAAFVPFAVFVLAGLAFRAAADLLTGLEDAFVAVLPLAVEFVAFFAAVLVVLAVDLPATRLAVLADTVVRDRAAAASTFLRPAESAADTATQTPALLRYRSRFLAWIAGIAALSKTRLMSSALT